jgi:hypothetical protein
MAKADNNSGGQYWHARLDGGLQRGRTRAAGERRQRHGVGMMVAEIDGGGGQQRRRMTTTATADDNNGEGGQQQQRMTTAADDDGTQDRVVDYEGEGGESSKQQRHWSPPGREHEKIKKSSLCKKTFFSDTVSPVGFFAPANLPDGTF